VVGVIDSAALPAKVKRESSFAGMNADASADPTTEKMEPDPV
jgi:hypothetical protein